MPTIKKILVPVDFSPCSKDAVEHALAFCDRFGATIDLLHAWDVPAYLRPDLTVWTGDVGTTLMDHAHKEAERSMEEFIKDLKLEQRADVKPQIVSGTPSDTVITTIDRGGYDLVVMGTHGRTGLSHLLLGSVAERVVRHSRCPVLTVRHAERAAAAKAAAG